jgi:hypothetical protein
MGVRQGLHRIAELHLFFIFLQTQAGCGAAMINGEGNNLAICRVKFVHNASDPFMFMLVLFLAINSGVLGLALLELSARVEVDPHGAFKDWDPMDSNPCNWSGVQCSDGKVEIL